MLNVSIRPQLAAVAAVSALAATAGGTSSDEILVEQIAAGSKPAMQALFARHRTYVYRWLLRFVSNEERTAGMRPLPRQPASATSFHRCGSGDSGRR